MKPYHPFPARMAPELALNSIKTLSANSVVLDPMSGSGTVLRQAAIQGHTAFGFDLDPLSVLMSKVATTNIDSDEYLSFIEYFLKTSKKFNSNRIKLPWIDDDPETSKFVEFWFASKQRKVLRQLAYTLISDKYIDQNRPIKNAIKLAISRIIVTKEQRASLARDTSHSRPHRVSLLNDFDVNKGVEISANQLVRIMKSDQLNGAVHVRSGDARNLERIENYSIDAIVTSPPYLNAIDYLRGHKMALVWFGYTMAEIRKIRSTSIGAERSLSVEASSSVNQIAEATGDLDRHSSRDQNMIIRFARDMHQQLSETARVLKNGGTAVYVVGNSCLRGNFVLNSNAVVAAANLHGLDIVSKLERDIPQTNRYLPMPSDLSNSLAKRMRTETVLKFLKAA